MAENVTLKLQATHCNELIYEVLKQIQERLTKVESTLVDHTRQFIRVREDINSVREDINGLRGDDLRRETVQANMDARLQRIENRLSLSDA
jgi:DNA-directed RNA polymerase subunit F